jgi:hypothetical protein
MSDATSQANIPQSRFHAMGCEEKMEALVHNSKRLELLAVEHAEPAPVLAHPVAK